MANSTSNKPTRRRMVTVEISPTAYKLLQVLTKSKFHPTESVEEVIERLIDHAQQGVYRPGAWERQWLCQVFGEDWTQHLKPGDPYGRDGCEAMFTKPAGGAR